MASCEQLAVFILSWEGGFADIPQDRGGATNKGVTIATWRTYCKKKGLTATVGTLRAMTQAQWNEIFKTMFWDRWQADQIADQSVANTLVDWVWASGVHGIRRVQRILGVTADGICGPKTLAALNARDGHPLFDLVQADRRRFVEEIVSRTPSQRIFLKGWLRRINCI